LDTDLAQWLAAWLFNWYAMQYLEKFELFQSLRKGFYENREKVQRHWGETPRIISGTQVVNQECAERRNTYSSAQRSLPARKKSPNDTLKHLLQPATGKAFSRSQRPG
jgi:hypothetical protein